MSVLVNRQPKSTAKPVSGNCRWILPIGEASGSGVLDINGTVYTVTAFRDGGRPAGYRLEKLDGRVYDIDAGGEHWTCDCPDANYRSRECKHVKALRAALAAEVK